MLIETRLIFVNNRMHVGKVVYPSKARWCVTRTSHARPAYVSPLITYYTIMSVISNIHLWFHLSTIVSVANKRSHRRLIAQLLLINNPTQLFVRRTSGKKRFLLCSFLLPFLFPGLLNTTIDARSMENDCIDPNRITNFKVLTRGTFKVVITRYRTSNDRCNCLDRSFDHNRTSLWISLDRRRERKAREIETNIHEEVN